MINAGQLKHKVQIQQPIMVQNETGEEVPDWQPVGEYWANIEPLNGREILQANVNLSEMDTRIHVRWSTSLQSMTTGWRILFKNIIYDVKSALVPDFARKEIEILAQSGINQG